MRAMLALTARRGPVGDVVVWSFGHAIVGGRGLSGQSPTNPRIFLHGWPPPRHPVLYPHPPSLSRFPPLIGGEAVGWREL